MALSTPEKAAAAALNNAVWCDSVCRAHGGATEFQDSVWMNSALGPRFYPNLITLRAGSTAAAEAAISQLDATLGRQWGLKDSFAELELDRHGFTPLFDASWLWRDSPPGHDLSPDVGELSWTAVTSWAELAEWERAWELHLGDASMARANHPQFPPQLLARRQIVFVAGRNGNRIVAGGVMNANAGVVGLSNVFAAPAARDECWAQLVNESQARFPGLPQCTYDRAPLPEEALRRDFEDVGPLRVWVR